MAELVVEEKIPLFVIGTELVTSVKHESQWRALIKTLRAAVAKSSVNVEFTYGSNWDPGPGHVSWWDAVDLIGVDAYYPVAKHPSPTAAELAAGWAPIVADLSAISAAHGGKRVLLVEVGYTTTDACAMGNHAGGAPSLEAQASAYEAVFAALAGQPFYAGVFFWDWESNPYGGGRCDTGDFSFTPAGKPAAAVLKTHFGGNLTTLVSRQGPRGHGAASGVPPRPVYSNGRLADGWQDYSYNGKTNLKSTAQLFDGDSYSAHFIGTNWGAMSFENGHGVVVPARQPMPKVCRGAVSGPARCAWALACSVNVRIPKTIPWSWLTTTNAPDRRFRGIACSVSNRHSNP